MGALILVTVATNSSLSANQKRRASAKPVGIIGFVRQTFIHGVPYDQASKYQSGDVPVLLRMLADPKEKRHRSNIVVTLCMIGDDRAADPLIAFIEKKDRGKLSRSVYTAKTSAIISLGYLINKSGNKKALTHLTNSLNPNVWTQKKLAWTSPFQEKRDDRNIQLSTMAVLGLSLSGHADAKVALNSLKQPAPRGLAKRFRSEVRPVVDMALKEHELISKKGLLNYQKEIKIRHEQLKNTRTVE